jgi:phosphohistidine phosphatase SixA
VKIFVLRHGMTSNADEDKDRELTATGTKEVEDVVTLRRDDLSAVTHIYSSPMLRVTQTLDIAARILGLQIPVTESQYLATGSRLPEIVSFANELDFDGGDVLFSSHQSCTSIFVLWLTGEDILIPNGSLLAIDVEKPEQGAGTILWQESRDGSNVKRAVNFVDQF